MSETPPERRGPVVGDDRVDERPLAHTTSDLPIPVRKPSETPTADLVCGVDPSLLERFLSLILNNYKRADKATFFLEQRKGIVNFQGITNVRDVLSHLVTFLDPNASTEKRLEQLSNAEEHLRRAINEPYEIALNRLTSQFDTLYDEYKRRVLPITDKHTTLTNAPNTTSIDARVREIRELTAMGRASKGANEWNTEWEAGVASFIEGFDKLEMLYTELQSHIFKVDQIEKEDERIKEVEALRGQVTSLESEVKTEGGRSTKLHLGGYVFAAIGIGIAIVTSAVATALVVSPRFLHWVQGLFGITNP